MKKQDQGEQRKLNLKTGIKRTTFWALVVLLLVGGGFEGSGWSLKTEGVPGIIRALNEFYEKKQEREMKEIVLMTGIKKLPVRDWDEVVKVIKQFSVNRDLPRED